VAAALLVSAALLCWFQQTSADWVSLQGAAQGCMLKLYSNEARAQAAQTLQGLAPQVRALL
jgi:hypothetical protein